LGAPRRDHWSQHRRREGQGELREGLRKPPGAHCLHLHLGARPRIAQRRREGAPGRAGSDQHHSGGGDLQVCRRGRTQHPVGSNRIFRPVKSVQLEIRLFAEAEFGAGQRVCGGPATGHPGERLNQTRSELDQTEEAKSKTHSTLARAKKDQESLLQAEVLEKQRLLQQAKLELVEAQRIYDEEQESSEAMTKMKAETKDKCYMKTIEYSMRKEDQQKEREAIASAVTTLKQEESGGKNAAGATSFLQDWVTCCGDCKVS
ncbi:unnamed protein product, partial [Effrenium voratum]